MLLLLLLRALSRSLACSDALTFSTHSHRFHLQSVTHLNRRKRHEPADDDPRTMWSPAAVAGRLSSSTWLVVVLLCAITLRVVAAGATITSQMSPRVVQTQYAILPHPNGISIGSADFAGLTVAVQTQYGRLRGVLVSIADPTSSGQPRRSTGPDLSPSPSLGRSQDPRTRRRAGSRPAASKSTWGSSTRPSSAADCASCRPRGRWRSGTADLNVIS